MSTNNRQRSWTPYRGDLKLPELLDTIQGFSESLSERSSQNSADTTHGHNHVKNRGREGLHSTEDPNNSGNTNTVQFSSHGSVNLASSNVVSQMPVANYASLKSVQKSSKEAGQQPGGTSFKAMSVEKRMMAQGGAGAAHHGSKKKSRSKNQLPVGMIFFGGPGEGHQKGKRSSGHHYGGDAGSRHSHTDVAIDGRSVARTTLQSVGKHSIASIGADGGTCQMSDDEEPLRAHRHGHGGAVPQNRSLAQSSISAGSESREDGRRGRETVGAYSSHEGYSDGGSLGGGEAEDFELDDSGMIWDMLRQHFWWISLVVIQGFMIGLTNVIFHKVAQILYDVWVHDTIEQEDNTGARVILRIVGVLGSSLLTGWVTAFFVPECCGGGMMAVKVCLLTNSSIPLKVGLARFALTSIYIGFGNTLGVEAPTLHICASVSCFLFDLFKMAAREGTFPDGHVKIMVMIACTCGVSCAFDTPFGGIMFVIEEFLHGASYSRTFIVLLILNVMVGVVTSRKMLGNKQFFDVKLDHGGEFQAWMAISLLCGVLGAMAAVIFQKYTLRLKKFYADVFDEEYDIDPPKHIVIFQKIFEPQYRPFWAGCVTCCFGLLTEESLGVPGVFHAGKTDIEGFFQKSYPAYKSIIFFFAKMAAVIAAVASDASGGVFYPALVLGASVGSSLQPFLRWVVSNWGTEAEASALQDTGRFQLVTMFGMIAVFSGIIRCPITAVIVVYEMTNVGKTRADLIFPSLAASVVSYFLASYVYERDIYDTVLHESGLVDDSEEEDEDQVDLHRRHTMITESTSMMMNNIDASQIEEMLAAGASAEDVKDALHQQMLQAQQNIPPTLGGEYGPNLALLNDPSASPREKAEALARMQNQPMRDPTSAGSFVGSISRKQSLANRGSVADAMDIAGGKAKLRQSRSQLFFDSALSMLGGESADERNKKQLRVLEQRKTQSKRGGELAFAAGLVVKKKEKDAAEQEEYYGQAAKRERSFIAQGQMGQGMNIHRCESGERQSFGPRLSSVYGSGHHSTNSMTIKSGKSDALGPHQSKKNRNHGRTSTGNSMIAAILQRRNEQVQQEVRRRSLIIDQDGDTPVSGGALLAPQTRASTVSTGHHFGTSQNSMFRVHPKESGGLGGTGHPGGVGGSPSPSKDPVRSPSNSGIRQSNFEKFANVIKYNLVGTTVANTSMQDAKEALIETVQKKEELDVIDAVAEAEVQAAVKQGVIQPEEAGAAKKRVSRNLIVPTANDGIGGYQQYQHATPPRQSYRLQSAQNTNAGSAQNEYLQKLKDAANQRIKELEGIILKLETRMEKMQRRIAELEGKCDFNFIDKSGVESPVNSLPSDIVRRLAAIHDSRDKADSGGFDIRRAESSLGKGGDSPDPLTRKVTKQGETGLAGRNVSAGQTGGTSHSYGAQITKRVSEAKQADDAKKVTNDSDVEAAKRISKDTGIDQHGILSKNTRRHRDDGIQSDVDASELLRLKDPETAESVSGGQGQELKAQLDRFIAEKNRVVKGQSTDGTGQNQDGRRPSNAGPQHRRPSAIDLLGEAGTKKPILKVGTGRSGKRSNSAGAGMVDTGGKILRGRDPAAAMIRAAYKNREGHHHHPFVKEHHHYLFEKPSGRRPAFRVVSGVSGMSLQSSTSSRGISQHSSEVSHHYHNLPEEGTIRHAGSSLVRKNSHRFDQQTDSSRHNNGASNGVECLLHTINRGVYEGVGDERFRSKIMDHDTLDVNGLYQTKVISSDVLDRRKTHHVGRTQSAVDHGSKNREKGSRVHVESHPFSINIERSHSHGFGFNNDQNAVSRMPIQTHILDKGGTDHSVKLTVDRHVSADDDPEKTLVEKALSCDLVASAVAREVDDNLMGDNPSEVYSVGVSESYSNGLGLPFCNPAVQQVLSLAQGQPGPQLPAFDPGISVGGRQSSTGSTSHGEANNMGQGTANSAVKSASITAKIDSLATGNTSICENLSENLGVDSGDSPAVTHKVSSGCSNGDQAIATSADHQSVSTSEHRASSESLHWHRSRERLKTIGRNVIPNPQHPIGSTDAIGSDHHHVSKIYHTLHARGGNDRTVKSNNVPVISAVHEGESRSRSNGENQRNPVRSSIHRQSVSSSQLHDQSASSNERNALVRMLNTMRGQLDELNSERNANNSANASSHRSSTDNDLGFSGHHLVSGSSSSSGASGSSRGSQGRRMYVIRKKGGSILHTVVLDDINFFDDDNSSFADNASNDNFFSAHNEDDPLFRVDDSHDQYRRGHSSIDRGHSSSAFSTHGILDEGSPINDGFDSGNSINPGTSGLRNALFNQDQEEVEFQDPFAVNSPPLANDSNGNSRRNHRTNSIRNTVRSRSKAGRPRLQTPTSMEMAYIQALDAQSSKTTRRENTVMKEAVEMVSVTEERYNRGQARHSSGFDHRSNVEPQDVFRDEPQDVFQDIASVLRSNMSSSLQVGSYNNNLIFSSNRNADRHQDPVLSWQKGEQTSVYNEQNKEELQQTSGYNEEPTGSMLDDKSVIDVRMEENAQAETHPSTHPSNNSRFNAIQEAYSIDPGKRKVGDVINELSKS